MLMKKNTRINESKISSSNLEKSQVQIFKAVNVRKVVSSTTDPEQKQLSIIKFEIDDSP